MGLIITVSRWVDSKRVRSCFAIVKAEIPSEMRQKAIVGFLETFILLERWVLLQLYDFNVCQMLVAFCPETSTICLSGDKLQAANMSSF